MEAIKRNLLLLTSSHNVKPTKSLLAAWMIATDILTPEQIDETAVYCMRERTSSFMPTTAEFIEIAERLKNEKAKEQRINKEIAESNRYIAHNPDGKKKVAEMALKIGSEIGKKKVEQPKFTIFEHTDQNGNFYYVSHGKIDFDVFKNEVLKFCGYYPQQIRYEHKRFEKVKKKYDCNAYRTYSTFVDKDLPSRDTQLFTVGYL